jgi:hypothetical protein
MKRVAVIPLKQFLDARSDSDLLTKLATSVERVATVKHLRMLARTTSLEAFRRAFNIAADHIEAAMHHD